MTRSKKLRVLSEICATIPSVDCKGLCADACSSIPVFPIELEQLEAAAGRRLPAVAETAMGAVIVGAEIGSACPLLVMGRCSVYEHRPFICRAFGAVNGMPCPHGCRPDVMITDAEFLRGIEQIAKL